MARAHYSLAELRAAKRDGKTYTTGELLERVGVSYSTLRRWVLAGHLEQPTKRSNGLSGVQLVWRPADVRRAIRLARLSRRGQLPPPKP